MSALHTRSLMRALVILFVGGCLGLIAELALTGHYEDWTQWIPIVLLAIGVLAGVNWLRAPGAKARVPFLLSGAGLAIGGLIGTVLHLKGNLEFELEMYPDLGGIELAAEAMTGATPVLAPGASLLLGLLAVILSHPRFNTTPTDT